MQCGTTIIWPAVGGRFGMIPRYTRGRRRARATPHARFSRLLFLAPASGGVIGFLPWIRTEPAFSGLEGAFRRLIGIRSWRERYLKAGMQAS